ncbi:aminotransferase class IV [Haloimpatiens lingqiaonensis]|uniref:aminotransferase class IV n=1 Tax=Haloimpatiens lingqiaonensis TaxID=1380675 RepID=UPI0010FE90FA|nr:aminotransferase class IV [Haloimpatiens lingqiaonensis]
MILLNGKLIEEDKVTLDSGFYFGRGLFETILVKNNPLFLEEHLNRLNTGLITIGINKFITADDVANAVLNLNCKNNVLKLVVTEKNTLFTCRENKYTEEIYKKGFRVTISDVRRNESSTLTYLKSINYIENILEHEKCIKQGFDEVLFFNFKDNLAEGSISNVFFVKNGNIYTPKVQCGLLNGTVRKYIVDNNDVKEGNFTEEDLLNSEGIFLTNSIMGVMWVSEICGKPLAKNRIIEKIKEEYELYVSNF